MPPRNRSAAVIRQTGEGSAPTHRLGSRSDEIPFDLERIAPPRVPADPAPPPTWNGSAYFRSSAKEEQEFIESSI